MRRDPTPFGPDADLGACRALGIAVVASLCLFAAIVLLISWSPLQ
ncbi:hypothetical protein [Sphingomonas sp. ABOLE]|nr:hypothetical protein [Sphingomonas sp. ABOLE]